MPKHSANPTAPIMKTEVPDQKSSTTEAGVRKKGSRATWAANLYYMRYKDQLVMTGDIDEEALPFVKM